MNYKNTNIHNINMELKIDLYQRKKKRNFLIVLGIILLILAIVWFFMTFNAKGTTKLSAWIHSLLFVNWGVFYIALGLGYQLESFFGKAYILIDSETISLKSGVFEEKQFINWNEIKSIDYNSVKAKLNIKKTDNSTAIIDISKFDYIFLQEIKKIINYIAKDKNIQSNF